jgi:CRISPR-associated protein Cas2
MLEMSAGVYVAPKLSAEVRDRIWEVVTKWVDKDGAATLLWQDNTAIGRISSLSIGETSISLADIDGLLVARR